MTQVDREYKIVFSRIPEIVADLLRGDRMFERLEKDEMIECISVTLKKYLSPEEILAIDEVELTRRIDKLLAIEVMYRLLDDLEPEQIEMFDAAVSGR